MPNSESTRALVNQPTSEPTRKVKAATLASFVGTFVGSMITAQLAQDVASEIVAMMDTSDWTPERIERVTRIWLTIITGIGTGISGALSAFGAGYFTKNVATDSPPGPGVLPSP